MASLIVWNCILNEISDKMNINDIINIAAELKWESIITPTETGKYYIDFLLGTTMGEPFFFSTEWSKEDPLGFLGDIEKVEQSFDIEAYIGEYLESLGSVNPAEYTSIIRELEQVHTRIWLLWFRLSIYNERSKILSYFPWYVWN